MRGLYHPHPMAEGLAQSENRPDLRRSLEDARRSLDQFCASDLNLAKLEAVAAALGDRIATGGRLLACGNGGSMAQSMHFAEELSGRFRNDRRPLPALACTDPGHLTCTANDYGFDAVFERWVEGLGGKGDALVCFSTSGNSANLVRAASLARAKGMLVVGLLGRGGGNLATQCDHWFDAPGVTADRVQEVHTVIMHTLIEGIEQRLGLA